MNRHSSLSDDAPYGLESLRAVPPAAFWAAALLALGLLGIALLLQGAARHLALLAAILLGDFGLAGLRGRLWPLLRARLPLVLAAVLAVAALGLGARHFAQSRARSAALAGARLQGTLTVQETAGIARPSDLIVVPAPAQAAAPQPVAVYEGNRRLSASLLVEPAGARFVVEAGPLGANEQRTLELYLGAAPDSGQADPETAWSFKDAYRSGWASVALGAPDPNEAAAVPPFFGRTSLRVAAEPLPDLRGAFLWADLPVPKPEQLGPDTHLLYAVRSEGGSRLRCSVQVKTDLGDRPLVDQDGVSAEPGADLGERSAGRWYLRRVSLKPLAGARLLSVGALVFDSRDEPQPPQPGVCWFDAVRIVEGPALAGQVSELRALGGE